MEETPTDTAHPAHSFWQSSRWYHALTLAERITSLQARPKELSISEPVNRERATRIMKRWKEQAPFNIGPFFADRLAMDGITESELLALLAEPIEVLPARLSPSTPPHWLRELMSAFEGETASPTAPFPIQSSKNNQARTALLKPFQPLLAQGISRLQAGINDLAHMCTDLPFDSQAIVPLLFANLSQLLLPRVSRTLVLELHVARLQERLQGRASEERFQSYIQLLSDPQNMLSLLEEYCVLARQVVGIINVWVAYSLEFLKHLCADWNDIRTFFSPESDPGVLTEVRGGAGDTHRGGRSVMLLTFSSGFHLVYKPKSLAVDRHFQDLLAWLNERGQHPAFRMVKLLDRGTYGWSEFIPAFDCTSEEEVERFYERQGSYLALLYALEAKDFHGENVIATGEHPLLIDLETLFHPRMEKDDLAGSEHPAQRVLDQSVLGVGLLPARLWSNEDAAGIDISGLGGQEGQLQPRPTPMWEGAGTDEMRLVRERVELRGGHNRPRLKGLEVQTADYREHIIAGFSNMYRLLMAHRAEMLTEQVPRFASDEIRFIARPTRMYTLLLWESFHPNLLRDALKRDRFLDRLWVGVQQEPALAKLIPAERADLLRGDIPMFTTYPNSRDLYTSQGERIASFFEAPSLELAKKRVQRLDEDDLARQTWMIRASLTSLTMGTNTAYVAGRRQALSSSRTLVKRERLMLAARAVGNRLAELALRSGDAIGWMGVTQAYEREWQVGPADQGLYAGTSGIVLFLAYLGEMSGEVAFTELARSALPTVRFEVEELTKRSAKAAIGAFEGLGAAIYLFSHIGTLWQELALFAEAEALVGFLPELIEQDEKFDVIGGAAGCIGSLLSLYAVAPSARTLAVAIQCGDHLVAHAQSMQVGIGWITLRQEMPLAGFAHGAAGIALSLLRLAEVSGQERFRDTALAALTYERSLFSPKKQNWPIPHSDMVAQTTDRTQKERADGDPGMVAWCYGAAGIGLSRLDLLQYIDDAAIRQEIDTALQTTIEHGFGRNHCLCHGDCGNLEMLLVATQVLDSPEYHRQVEHLTTGLLASIETQGWVSGVPFGVETPGLMNGLAGIGYGLLRLVAPERVPSVLLLAPPHIKEY